MPTKP